MSVSTGHVDFGRPVSLRQDVVTALKIAALMPWALQMANLSNLLDTVALDTTYVKPLIAKTMRADACQSHSLRFKM